MRERAGDGGRAPGRKGRPAPAAPAPRDAWLARDPLPDDPLPVLEAWQREAFEARLERTPDAVALATVDPDGRPSVRMVLCKAIEVGRAGLVFYTRRESRKGRALAANPHAALAFHWGPQERQARVEGPVAEVEPTTADAYFAARPRDAQLGAWASRQSEAVASRDALEAAMDAERERFGDDPIPRPPGWTGYRLTALRVELWKSRPGRLHDRACWTREAPGAPWSVERLQP